MQSKMKHQLMNTFTIAFLMTSCAESMMHDNEEIISPLIKCCDAGEFYNAGFDSCMKWGSDGTGHDDVEFLLSFSNLTRCPNGHVVKISTDFKIFENGSIKTAEEFVREPGDFCVNRIIDKSNSQFPMFASRFCIADPCEKSSSGCIRKCCPTGMILDEIDKICHPNPMTFVVAFQDENGEPLLHPTSIVTRDGIFVDCKFGKYSLRPSEEEDDEFFILSNGTMMLSSTSELIDDYCIDQVATEDGTVTCFSNKYLT
jgi:hypothetical protein